MGKFVSSNAENYFFIIPKTPLAFFIADDVAYEILTNHRLVLQILFLLTCFNFFPSISYVSFLLFLPMCKLLHLSILNGPPCGPFG